MSKAIRLKIHDMLDKHCGNCRVKEEKQLDDDDFETHCIYRCEIGLQLQELGRKLAPEEIRNRPFKWTKEDERRAVEMRKQGASYNDIAKMLGMYSPSSIKNKWHKLKKQGAVV
jgi:hypothetical protein